MLFRAEFYCDTEAFSKEPPNDLLGETARILKEITNLVEQQQLDILSGAKHTIRDSDDNVIGYVCFW